MKRIIFQLLLLLVSSVMFAEDTMQIIPKTLRPGMGVDDEDAYLEVDLRNSTYNEVGNLQFDILLPEGVEYDDYYEFDGARVPYKSGRGGTTWAFSITVVPQATNYIRFMFVPQPIDGSLKPITGNEGTFLRIYIRTSESLAEGVYPVKMANMNYYHTEVEGVYLDDAVSYVKVGEQTTNTVYNLGGTSDEEVLVPSFVQTALNAENNVVVNGSCKSLVLTDGYDFSAPVEFTAANASYEREMTTTWGTIVLPFEVASDENIVYYLPSEVEGSALKLTRQEVLPANTPALVENVSGSGIAVNKTNVDVADNLQTSVNNTITMYGSYTNDVRVDNPSAYYINNDKFWLCNEYFYANAFRGYFTVAGSAAKTLSVIVGDGVTTGVDGMNTNNVEGYYDLSGKRFDSLQKGVNIVKTKTGESYKVIVE